MEIYIISAIFIALALYIYSKTRRRKQEPFPKKWHKLLLDNVHFYSSLSKEKQLVFQNRMMQFLSEVYIESVGFTLTDLDKVFVACSAVIPVFGFDEWHYNNLSGVLLYPDHFNNDMEFDSKAESRSIGGIVGNGRLENQMIFSRKALYSGFLNKTDKNNTGIHEFVHLIDKMDGIVDGIPEALIPHQYAMPWLKLIHKEIEAINDDKSDIRQYGGTNQAEFFAVASEYFFERPDLLRVKHPELYKMMKECFNQKPQSAT
ncbi:M90 family metallopeptidase [Flavobacterium rhizosphaerae]|uniref:M90 family metallopeptidase n=1 Tax=Flavobacterium rhizosphaerae TaxID=3163298 RepID=A0ABW8YXW2_9FLAO